MTTTSAPETVTQAGDIEVLLREAKRRSRLRRLAIVALALAAPIALALILAGVSGAGPSRTPTSSSSSGAVPIAAGTLKAVGFPPSTAQVSFSNVSCASGTACIVVGEVASARTWRNGAWSYGQGTWSELATPVKTDRDGPGPLSCPTTTFCVMASNHWGFTNASELHASVQVYAHGNWHEVITPTPSGSTESYLQAIDCVSSQWCMALGVAWMHFGEEVYADLFANGHWSLLAVPRPQGDYEPGVVDVNGVSCTSSTFCLAVGDAPGHLARFATAEQYDGTTWSLVHVAQIPQGLLGRPARIIEGKKVTILRFGESLTGVSCASPVACTASGSFDASLTVEQIGGMFVMHYDGLRLSKALLIAKGPDAGHPTGQLGGIACSSASRCTSWISSNLFLLTQQPAPLNALQYDAHGWFLSAKLYRKGLVPQPTDVSCLPGGHCLIVGRLEGNYPSGNARFSPLAVVATPR
jgi:hypothetical protein